MSTLLAKYKSTDIRHPSWRIYKAIQDIKELETVDKELRDELSVEEFGLNPSITVHIPFSTNDELTDNIIAAIVDKNYEDTYFLIKDCMSLFVDVKSRQPIECMLMAGLLAADIAADLGYRPELVETYACAFFDVSVWRTEADKLAYVSRGIVGEDKRIKTMVSSYGLDYVLVREYKLPTKVKMDKALLNMFGKMYQQTMNMLESSDLEEQKLAQGWSKRVLDVFSELKNANKDEGGIRELTIALQTSPAPKKGIENLE